MKRKIALGVAAVLVVAAAALGVRALFFSPDEVETIPVQSRDVVEVIVASGRLRTQTLSDLGTDVSGVVDAVSVEPGDRVEAAQELVTLRPADIQNRIDRERAALRTQREELRRARAGATPPELTSARANVTRAEASLDQARSAFERARALLENGVETPANVEMARTRFEEAKADLERAKSELELVKQGATTEEIRVARARVQQAEVALTATRNDLEKYTVIAPFDGLVTGVMASPGETVSPGSPLVTVAKMDEAEIYVEVDEDYLDRLRPGLDALAYFRSQPDREYRATLEQVGPEVDTERGIVGLHLAPEQLPPDAFPGLTADVNIEVAEFSSATAVPLTAIVRERGSQPYVLVVSDGTASRQNVEVVGEGDVWAAVDEIEEGTVVVLDAAKLEPGASIESREVGPEAVGDDAVSRTPEAP